VYALALRRRASGATGGQTMPTSVRPDSQLLRACALASVGLALLGAGCSTEKAAAPKPCCEQPKIPAGVTPFVVVADDVTGPSDGERVIMRVGLSSPIKRDQVYPVLHTLYRHVMKRGPFEPIHFVASVYADESAAKSGGDSGLVARIVREQSDLAPKCENKVTYDFSEQVGRAFAAENGRAEEEDGNDTCHLAEKKVVARHDDKFSHKPSYKIDAARQAVEITYPYTEMGKDEYVADLKFNSAMRDWVAQTSGLFRKVQGLKEVSFVGVHKDQPVVKISVNRPQFESSLASVQEDVAAHAAITFASLGLHKKDDKGAEKEQAVFHSKTYKTALASLPKNQVFVSPKLK
jgi:hypothetical protein